MPLLTQASFPTVKSLLLTTHASARTEAVDFHFPGQLFTFGSSRHFHLHNEMSFNGGLRANEHTTIRCCLKKIKPKP